MKWEGSSNDIATAYSVGRRYANNIMHQTQEKVDAGGSSSHTNGRMIERSVQ